MKKEEIKNLFESKLWNGEHIIYMNIEEADEIQAQAYTADDFGLIYCYSLFKSGKVYRCEMKYSNIIKEV